MTWQELEALAAEREVEREQAELLARALRADLAEARAGLDCTSTRELAMLDGVHAHNSSEEVAYWDAADAAGEGEQDGCSGLEHEHVQPGNEEVEEAWDAAHDTVEGQQVGDARAPQAVQHRCRKEVVAWQLPDVGSEGGQDDGIGLDDMLHGCTVEATDWDAAEAASEDGQEEAVSFTKDAHVGVEEIADLVATDEALGGVQADGRCAAENKALASMECPKGGSLHGRPVHELETAVSGCADSVAYSDQKDSMQHEPSREQPAVSDEADSAMREVSPPEHVTVMMAQPASPASSQMLPHVQSQLETLRCSTMLMSREHPDYMPLVKMLP